MADIDRQKRSENVVSEAQAREGHVRNEVLAATRRNAWGRRSLEKLDRKHFGDGHSKIPAMTILLEQVLQGAGRIDVEVDEQIVGRIQIADKSDVAPQGEWRSFPYGEEAAASACAYPLEHRVSRPNVLQEVLKTIEHLRPWASSRPTPGHLEPNAVHSHLMEQRAQVSVEPLEAHPAAIAGAQ